MTSRPWAVSWSLAAMASLLMSLLAGLLPTQAGGDTTVGGDIVVNTTWTKANSPYIITSGLLVASGTILTIEPGVVVKFESAKGMQIDGGLIAQGTPAEQIVFTSNEASPGPGNWGNIVFADTSVDASCDETGNYVSGSIMQYCTIEYAGASDVPALKLVQSSPLIDHCTIRNNGHQGLRAEGTYDAQAGLVNGLPRITGNSITGNAREGMSAAWGNTWNDELGACLVSGNTISNNSGIGVTISYGAVKLTSNTISGNASMGIQANGSSLSIDKNTISGNSGPGSGCGIGMATCIASITGNTISNNVSVSGSSGYEGGIHAAAGIVVISGNTISGNSARTGAGVYADGLAGGTFTIAGNTISNNSAEGNGGGLAIYGNDVIVAYNNITGNIAYGGDGKAGGIYVSGAPKVIGNNLFGNTPYDVSTANPQASPEVDVTENWWGTSDENLMRQHIWDWYDDASLSIVDYTPFYTTATEINCLPHQPANVTPTAGDYGTSVPTMLQASPFLDYDSSDTHAASQWQIASLQDVVTPDFSKPVFDSGADADHLTSIGIPSDKLTCGAGYAWRARYRDNRDAWSRWSVYSPFVMSCDLTPPTTPTVNDDGEFTESTTQLHAGWSSSDPESGILEYQYAVGTSRGGTDLVEWTSAGTAAEITVSELTLVLGQTYYFAVKARNGAEMWSEVGISDGITMYADYFTDFSADATAVLVEQSIKFTAQTATSFDTWRWDFGDGNTSTAKNPSHSYDTAGSYNVSLTASNGAVSNTKTKMGYITVHEPLEVDFSADPRRCSEGDNVTFVSLAAGGIPPLRHAWDFDNDGTADSTVKDPIHSYALMDAYTVSLTVTDAAGNSDIQTKTMYVVVTRPLADQKIGPDGGVVEASNGQLRVEFPAGAVSATSRVIIRQLPPLGMADPPRGFRVGETCFSIEVVDAEGHGINQMLAEIAITIRYSEKDLAAARGDPDRLRTARWDDAAVEWMILDVAADVEDGIFVVYTDHLSDWAVLAKVPRSGIPFWVWIIVAVLAAVATGFVARCVLSRSRD